MRIFALQDVRDAAAEFDDLKPALDIALRIGDHLAVFGREQVRQRIHVRFNERLEIEHDARTPLRVGRSPARLSHERRLNRALEHSRIAQHNPRLHAAIIGIENIAETA